MKKLKNNKKENKDHCRFNKHKETMKKCKGKGKKYKLIN